MNFTLMSEMPSYFTDVLGFDLRSAGILCIFPYLALYGSAIFFGKFFEYLERTRGWHLTDVRRMAQFIAYGVSGVGLVLCGFVRDTMGAYSCMVFTLVRKLLIIFIYIFVFCSICVVIVCVFCRVLRMRFITRTRPIVYFYFLHCPFVWEIDVFRREPVWPGVCMDGHCTQLLLLSQLHR